MSNDRLRTTRRGVLALSGAAALAGCNGLLDSSSSSGPEISGQRIAEITSGERPSVPRTVPVAIGGEHVARHADRTRSLLDQAPLPFDEQELPNEAMREEIHDVAETARTDLDRAETAASPLEAVSILRKARGHGRAVATAWRYIDQGLRRYSLADEAAVLADDVAAFRDRRSYLGDDPVRATSLHATVESLVSAAATNVDGRPENPRQTRRPQNLVTVSEFAADLERGRAALADATYLYDRFRDDLRTTRNLRATFEAGLSALLDSLESATADLGVGRPLTDAVDANLENSPVQYPLRYLYDDLDRTASIDDHRDQGELASALRAVHREFTRLRAFEDLRDRVEDDEEYGIESASDLASLRSTAVSAIGTALESSAYPDLSRGVLHNMTSLIESVDEEISPYEGQGTIAVDSIRRDVGQYIYAAAVARATPPVSATVAEALID